MMGCCRSITVRFIILKDVMFFDPTKESDLFALHSVFSLSFSSAGKGQFLTGIFYNNLYSFSEPSRGCRW